MIMILGIIYILGTNMIKKKLGSRMESQVAGLFVFTDGGIFQDRLGYSRVKRVS